MATGGGGVYFVPPEFYGLNSLGQAIGQVGQAFEQRKDKKRQEKREDEVDAMARENHVINKANTILQTTGDRQSALNLLISSGIAPTDSRVKMKPEELLDEISVTALRTPAGQRTDEDWALVGKLYGLPAGFTPQMMRTLADRKLAEAGLTQELLASDVNARKQYEEFLKSKGYTPGRMQAEMEFIGLESASAGVDQTKAQTGLTQAQTRLTDAQVGLVGAQTEATRADAQRVGLNPVAEKILSAYAEKLSAEGLPPMTTVKALTAPDQLSPEETDALAVALTNIAKKAAATKDRTQLLDAVVAAQKAGVSFGPASAAMLAQALNEAMGAEVAVATPPEERFLLPDRPGSVQLTPEGQSRFRVQIDLAKAVGATGGDPAIVEQAKQVAANARSEEELEALYANLQSTEVDNALRPIFASVLEEEARKRGIVLGDNASAATTNPSGGQANSGSTETQPTQQQSGEAASTSSRELIQTFKQAVFDRDQKRRFARSAPESTREKLTQEAEQLSQRVEELKQRLKTEAPAYYETVKNK